MRLKKIFIDFLKIFIFIKSKPSKKNYSFKVKSFSSSRSQIIEQKHIVNKINFFNKKRILDYGCNDCSFKRFLKKGFLYWGVDNNSEIINKKIKKYSNKFKLVKNYKMPFKKNFFDCILVSHVIAHVTNTSLLLINLRKVLAKDGIIIIVSPNKYYKFFYFFRNVFNNYYPDETILKHYSMNEILKILKKNSFKIVKYYKYSIKGNKIISSYLNSRILVIAKK